VISFEPADGTYDVRPDSPVVVRVSGGRLSMVSVRAADGTVLTGSIDPSGGTWTAQPGLMPFATAYSVEATAVDAAGQGKVAQARFGTLTPSALLKTRISPAEGEVVGVGMPIVVSLTSKPVDRAAVERGLHVTTTPAVGGAWRWVSSTELHWRPQNYWQPGTHVTVNSNLLGVDAGNGVWGSEQRSVLFSIGAAQVSTVDIAAHQMTVTRNGQTLRTIPITTGKPGFDTRNGIKIIMTKERTKVMDSRTIDIPADSPDAYHLTVDYAMRLTNSGEFLHAAPWSVKHQGVDNVSHGCTGMSTENAAWLYSLSKRGDVVQYVHGHRSLERGNGITDWNTSWSDWLAGSALR
jgi:lipoprotein-anchoring transpeptidase ErfK/SrfK